MREVLLPRLLIGVVFSRIFLYRFKLIPFATIRVDVGIKELASLFAQIKHVLWRKSVIKIDSSKPLTIIKAMKKTYPTISTMRVI